MTEEQTHQTAKVIKIKEESTGLLAATLEVAADVSAAYSKPGQYIVLHPKASEKPVFMALASAPGHTELELLIGQPAADKLQFTEGSTVRIDPPAGNGYPVDLAKGKNVILFAVGSGMSAIRSLIEYIRANRDEFRNVDVFLGAHTEESHPYRQHDEAWAADNISIHRTTSRPWVQDVFRNSSVSAENAVAFVCGMKEMVTGVTEALTDAGMDAELIRQNY
mgnify:CR=1 FL=1